MKKGLVSILVATLALFSCAQCTTPAQPEPDPKPDPEKQDPEQPAKPVAGNYVLLFPDQTGTPKTGWEAGDQIYFYGNYAPNAKVITLKESDITDGGKKATVYLDDDLMEYQCVPDGIYAAYPAQAVRKGDSLISSDTEYSDWSQVLLQAYLDKDQFKFRSLNAVIKFTVSGDFDSYAFASTEREGMRVTGYNADLTSEREQINTFTTDGYPYREGTLTADGSTVNYIFMPGGKRFKKGFSFYFGKNGVFDKIYTNQEALTIEPGAVLDLGDITASVADYSGPAPKMPEMGKRTKYTVKFNELSGLCLSADGSFLWGVGDDSEIVKLSFTGEVLPSSKAALKTTTGSSIDSEAISLRYDNGDLLIGGEPSSVLRIPNEGIDNIFKEKTFKGVEGLFLIKDANSFDNAGLEGLTYYKDGLAYAGTQTGSYLYLCDLATGEVKWRKGLREMFPVITEIADLCYDPLTDWLWIIDSESQRVFALTGDAENMLGYYSVRGTGNCESICIDHKQSCIWVADDDGSTSYLYRIDFTGLDDAIIQ